MRTVFALLACGCIAAVGQAATKVGDFALLDHDGYFHKMSYYDDHTAIALLVQTNADESLGSSLQTFAALREQYAGRIKFFMINPTGGETRASVKTALAAYGTDIPVLMDDTQIVAESMGIERSGEALLYDPRSFSVIYRGPADANLEAAIERVLDNDPIETEVVATDGPSIDYADPEQLAADAISYADDVAPILADNCARCHREGGIAPWAMINHTMILGWSPMIREVVMTKRMPPGQIDPHVGDFEETYTLTPEESRTLIRWIDAGSQSDGQRDPLAQLEWPDTKWELGEPDYIIRIPPQDVPATGVLPYYNVTVPLDGLDRDRWVRASQYVPGDRTVLHHTLNSLIPPQPVGQDRARAGGGFLGGGDDSSANIAIYIPGAGPEIEPPDTGGLLRAGSTLRLQMHYTTTGKASVDASEIGLWFYDDDEIPTERMSGACACIFTNEWVQIPPFESDHEMTQTVSVREDTYLYSMLPHMHYRGKWMRFYADYPDGSSEELLNIANYNYNWQLRYRPAEPKLLPAGTQVRVTAAFDNSTRNHANPDPSRAVPWGLQSWDEMFFGAIQWKTGNASDSE